jgi:hypothetical protein
MHQLELIARLDPRIGELGSPHDLAIQLDHDRPRIQRQLLEEAQE